MLCQLLASKVFRREEKKRPELLERVVFEAVRLSEPMFAQVKPLQKLGRSSQPSSSLELTL